MRACTQCKVDLPLTAFGKKGIYRDGLNIVCKKCNCENTKKYYLKHREERAAYSYKRNRLPEVMAWKRALKKTEKYREYDREYQRTKKHASWKIAGRKRWRRENPEKKHAQARAQWVYKEKKPCKWCGHSERVVRHHPDYNKPLEIIWFCHPCHSKWHKENEAIPLRKIAC